MVDGKVSGTLVVEGQAVELSLSEVAAIGLAAVTVEASGLKPKPAKLNEQSYVNFQIHASKHMAIYTL